jgi:hypothetical protein
MSTVPPPAASRRRRIAVLLIALAGALALALLPVLCTRYETPESYHATYAELPRGPDRVSPALVPPSATRIRERHEVDAGARWVSFRFDPRDLPAMTRGLRLLSPEEVERLAVRPPPFTPWWTINRRTLRGSQGKRLQVYEVPGADAGWLAVDPRSNLAFYWSRV